jgi:dTDP-4-amino-4,6-dideoxygalactose transaminase
MRSLLRINQPCIGKEEIEAVTEVLKDGLLTDKSGAGPQVLQFEKAFSKYTGAKYAIAVNSGTAALHASLMASNIGQGDEVLVPSFTFPATAGAVLLVGAKPIFIDIDPKTYCMRVDLIESKISNKTSAIIPVHLYGLPADMNPIIKVARQSGLTVIEDAAQAVGAEYQNKKIGNIGDASCFSFYGVKNITTGEGGMVTTNEAEFAEKIRRIRVHGEERPYWVSTLGHNYRMPEIAASIGTVQLKKLPTFLEKRRKNAEHLTKKLQDIKKLDLTLEPEGSKHAWHLYTVRMRGANAGKRNRVVSKLRSKNIGAAVYYETPVHLLPLYQKYASQKVDLQETEKASRQVFSLPIHPMVKQDHIEEIAKNLERILTKN